MYSLNRSPFSQWNNMSQGKISINILKNVLELRKIIPQNHIVFFTLPQKATNYFRGFWLQNVFSMNRDNKSASWNDKLDLQV